MLISHHRTNWYPVKKNYAKNVIITFFRFRILLKVFHINLKENTTLTTAN